MQVVKESVLNKWRPILEHPDLGGDIRDPYRKRVVAQILENTEHVAITENQIDARNLISETSSTVPANFMGASSSTAGAGGIDIFDPVMISLLRRSMPNLMAFDVGGVQPMKGPVSLIFAMRSRYANQAGNETFYNEVNTAWSTVVGGANTIGDKHTGTVPFDPTGANTLPYANLASQGIYNYADAMSTAQAEALGSDSNTAFAEMAFSIEKVSATAGSRALAAGYTMEMAQDLKTIHGLDAESELSDILTSEILAEINREFVRTINVCAKQGAQTNTTTAGVFDLDTDSNGRWLVEKFKGMMFLLEREANQIAKDTRRGKGNIVICSSDVASALQMAGILDYTPALNGNNLQVDDTGNTFAGVLNGRIKVYIDPYSAGGQYFTMGYRGASPFDAGIFYCPYVPLQMVRATDQGTFHPRIGFKTRYAVVPNPFAQGLTRGYANLVKDSNVYYRRVAVMNLM